MSPRTKYFSYAPSSPVGTSPPPTSPQRPQSMVLPSPTMQPTDNDRGNVPMNHIEGIVRTSNELTGTF